MQFCLYSIAVRSRRQGCFKRVKIQEVLSFDSWYGEARQEQAVRIPTRSGLLQEPCQDGSVLRIEEVATPSEQATDAHRMLGHLVAAHGAIAFFDPPADGALRGVVGAIERFAFGAFPAAIARQAMPQVPAIQKQEPQAIGEALMLSFARRRGLQIASVQRFQFRGLLALATSDQFP